MQQSKEVFVAVPSICMHFNKSPDDQHSGPECEQHSGCQAGGQVGSKSGGKPGKEALKFI